MLSVRSFKNKNNKIFILYFFFWRIIYWILGNFYTSGFFLSTFKYFSLLLTCMVSQEKSHRILILPLLSFFPPLTSFILLCIFDFLQFEYHIPGVDCSVFILLGVLWTSWICVLVSVISVEKSWPLLFQIFFPILFPYLFLVFLLYICYTFCNCPTVFGYSDSLKPIF